MTSPPPARPLSVSDVADRLGITVWQVRRLIDQEDLVAIDIGTTSRPSRGSPRKPWRPSLTADCQRTGTTSPAMAASTTKMSLDTLRAQGYSAEVVERWLPAAAGGQQVKRDLFGFLDILALRGAETLGVQTTSKANMSAHARKIVASPLYPAVVAAGWKVIVHGWHQPRGKGTRYELAVLEVTDERVS